MNSNKLTINKLCTCIKTCTCIFIKEKSPAGKYKKYSITVYSKSAFSYRVKCIIIEINVIQSL